jgi:hypothetical protein
MQPPKPAAAANGAPAHADALSLLHKLQSQLSGTEEMAGKLRVLQQALQQVRCRCIIV